MPDIDKYVPHCTCKKLPHEPGCEVAPFFDDADKLTLAEDEEQELVPFRIHCPRGCTFHQFEHAISYDYTPVSGDTENTDIPIVCPECGWSDKQSLPAIVGFDPNEDVQDEHFQIQCPSCGEKADREDGGIQIWLEKRILMGEIESVKIGISTKYRGDILSEFTELSIECPTCGYQVGETDD